MAHSGKGPLPLRPDLMKKLRTSLPRPPHIWRGALQSKAAHLIGVGVRTIQRWETVGAPEYAGWAYVGVAFRVGGADAARATLKVLAQADLDGSAVWGEGGR